MKLLRCIPERFFPYFCSLLFAALAACMLSCLLSTSAPAPFDTLPYILSSVIEGIFYVLAAVGCLWHKRRLGIFLVFPLIRHLLIFFSQGFFYSTQYMLFAVIYCLIIRLFLFVHKKQAVRDGLFTPFLLVLCTFFQVGFTLLFRNYFPTAWLLECLVLSALLLWRLRMTLSPSPRAAAAPAEAPEEAPRETHVSVRAAFDICKGPCDVKTYTIHLPSLMEDFRHYRRRQAFLDKRELLEGACSPVLSTDKMLLAFEQAEWERDNNKSPYPPFPMTEPADYAEATLVDLVRLYVLGKKKGIVDAVDADRRTRRESEEEEKE